jgi:hypothetical protein
MLMNSVHTARHGPLCNSLNMSATVTVNRAYGKQYGERLYGVVRSRNKVTVGEPVVGEYEFIFRTNNFIGK